MVDTVVIEAAPSALEPPPEPDATAVEAAASGAVEIAAIEAEARVEIAEIRAETERLAIEAQHEQHEAALDALRMENAACRTEMEALRSTVMTLEATLASLTLPPSTQPDGSQTNPLEGVGGEAISASREEEPEAAKEPSEPAPRRRKHRWI